MHSVDSSGARNAQILVSEVAGTLRPDHFTLVEGAIPIPGPGEVLAKTLYVSVDPTNRLYLGTIDAYESSDHSGMSVDDTGPELTLARTRNPQPMRDIRKGLPLRPGDVMDAFTLCEVVDGNGTDLRVGDIVHCMAGWQEFATVPAAWARPIVQRAPLSHHVGVLGLTGMTSYFGMLRAGRPRSGETVVVSSAAGAVGSVAAQLAKQSGARVIGLAGSAEKRRVLTEQLGLAGALDYRSPTLERDLAETCPNGVDLYFDNVGGRTLEVMLGAMAEGGRIVCCGSVSQYDEMEWAGIPSIPIVLAVRSLTMIGFSVLRYVDEWPSAEAHLADLVAKGDVVVLEEVGEGLASLPSSLIGMLAGRNIGKRMVRVGAGTPDAGSRSPDETK